MYTTKGYVEITKEFILTRINEYDIFKYYISDFQIIGKKFSSPFRKDTDPSCCIREYNGNLFMKDFTSNRSYTFEPLIMELYSLNYNQALLKVANDFDLYKIPINSILKTKYDNDKIKSNFNKKTIIHIKIRDWNKDIDYNYWNTNGINIKTLIKFKVFPISKLWINHLCIKCKYPTYAYYFKQNYEFKILTPSIKGDGKWYSNTTINTLQGYEQLPEVGELLIITSSLKDGMFLTQRGYNSVAPQSESSLISKEKIQELKSRFKTLILFYDNDGDINPQPGEPKKGKYWSTKNSLEYGIPKIELPEGEKDITDYYKKYGEKPTMKTFKEILNEVYK